MIFLDVGQAVFEIGVIFVVVLATSTGFFFPPLSLLYSAQRSHGSLLCYSCGPARTRVRTSAYSINRGEAGARPLSSPQQLFDDTTVLEANKLSSIHVATHSCSEAPSVRWLVFVTCIGLVFGSCICVRFNSAGLILYMFNVTVH